MRARRRVTLDCCSRKIAVNGDSYAWIDREELPVITNVYHIYADRMLMRL